jgi:hypothetical protein
MIAQASDTSDQLFLRPGCPGKVYASRSDYDEDEAEREGGLYLAGWDLLTAALFVRPPFTPWIYVPFPMSA